MNARIFRTVAVASVALVILIDLATGQGPPIYNSYLQAQQDFRGPPPPPPPGHPAGFMPPIGYGPGEPDKGYKKAIEFGKGDYKNDKTLEKEFKKDEEKAVDKYDKQYKDDDKYSNSETTPAPGVLSSFSNSMSDAWKSISSLGRSKRETSDDTKRGDVSATKETSKGKPVNGKGESLVPTAERSMDSYEYLQYKNQGYVYFKVPKYLVCNY